MSPRATCPTCHQRLRIQRNVEQNALYWKLLQLISSTLRPNGETFTPNAYHEYYARKFLPCIDVKMPNGVVSVSRTSTSELSVDEFSDYFDAVAEDARDRGVILPPEDKPW